MRLVFFRLCRFGLCICSESFLFFLCRLRFFEDAEYIFVTKCIEKTTDLLNIIQVFDSQDSKCSLGR